MYYLQFVRILSGLLLVSSLNACAVQATNQENGIASSQGRCSDVTGFSALLPAPILIVGEYHGSNEIPLKFSSLVCQVRLARPEERILIGLELPIEFDQIFSKRKTVTLADAAAMIDQLQFWDRFGDGRHSEAMRNLTHTLMTYSYESNGQIELIAYQRKNIDSAGANAILERMAALKADRVIVLTGNWHARKAVGLNGPSYPPMGQNLMNSGKEVISLNIKYGMGDAWICLPECAKRRLPVFPVTERSDIVLDRRIADGAYDGYLYIEHLTVSDGVDRASVRK